MEPARTSKEKSQFQKDLRRVVSQGKDFKKYRAVLTSLLNEEPLDPKLKDHELTHDWKDHQMLKDLESSPE